MSNLELKREKEFLKKSFRYLSVDQDCDFLTADLDRAMFRESELNGAPIFLVASDFVIDAYFEKGALEPLAAMYMKGAYCSDGRYQRLMELLLAQKRKDLIKRMWDNIVWESKADFFYQLPRREFGEMDVVDEFKQVVIDAYEVFIGYMQELGEEALIDSLRTEQQMFHDEEFKVQEQITDSRTMDEKVFFDLIKEAGVKSESINQHMLHLAVNLEQFHQKNIKKFSTIFARHMKNLYHWNVWALAYVARDGCSDTSFEGFRTWLIMQGDQDLLNVAIKNPADAASFVQKDPDIPDGSLSHHISSAYLRRTGKFLQFPNLDYETPKGRKWGDEDLVKIHPELVAHYRVT